MTFIYPVLSVWIRNRILYLEYGSKSTKFLEYGSNVGSGGWDNITGPGGGPGLAGEVCVGEGAAVGRLLCPLLTLHDGEGHPLRLVL